MWACVARVTFTINRWNVAGAFHMPKAIDVYCRKQSGVTNAEISEARGVKGTCQYPFNKSSLVTKLADPTLSTQSSIRGRGKESGLVTAFTLRKSVQNRHEPSGLGTSKHGELHGLWLGTAKPWVNKYSTSVFITWHLLGFARYGCCLIGLHSPTSMSWVTTVVCDGTSLNSKR